MTMHNKDISEIIEMAWSDKALMPARLITSTGIFWHATETSLRLTTASA